LPGKEKQGLAGKSGKKFVLLLADSDKEISLAEYVCGSVAICTYLGR